MKPAAILSIACAVLLMALGWTSTVAYERLDTQKAKISKLEEQLTSAQTTAERWRVTATELQGRVTAQSILAQACLNREQELWQDIEAREAGMVVSPPVPIPNTQQLLGVSRETRRAFVTYYNQPVD